MTVTSVAVVRQFYRCCKSLTNRGHENPWRPALGICGKFRSGASQAAGYHSVTGLARLLFHLHTHSRPCPRIQTVYYAFTSEASNVGGATGGRRDPSSDNVQGPPSLRAFLLVSFLLAARMRAHATICRPHAGPLIRARSRRRRAPGRFAR